MWSNPEPIGADDGVAEDSDAQASAPSWAVFGDLMAGLVGAFVLVLIGVLVVQMDLVSSLQAEVQKRQQEQSRRQALEQALAVPLQSGRITLNQGRIGISGSLLFDLNSDQLRPDGQALLQSLVPPLKAYLAQRDELLMVSGFTDDRPIQQGNRRFSDNLELSAQRALTVTRALVQAGMPPTQLFSAAFGAEQAVASNATEAGRALNRRVEMAPVPRGAPGDRAPVVAAPGDGKPTGKAATSGAATESGQVTRP